VNSAQGNVNPGLYIIASTVPNTFHDIANGANWLPCQSGSPGCSNGVIGYTAARGYDLATGLGSVDVFKLLTAWPSLLSPRWPLCRLSIASTPLWTPSYVHVLPTYQVPNEHAAGVGVAIGLGPRRIRGHSSVGTPEPTHIRGLARDLFFLQLDAAGEPELQPARPLMRH